MEKVNYAITSRMKIFLRLQAFYNLMELAEITKKEGMKIKRTRHMYIGSVMNKKYKKE